MTEQMSPTAVAEPSAPKTPRTYVWGVGRRKSSVARVRIAPGSGKIEINGRTLQILDRDVVEVVREFKQEWYRRLAQRCDELTLERKDRRRA